MQVKRLIRAAIAVIAFSPIAAFAGGGDDFAKEWLSSLQGASTRSVEEVRAEARQAPNYGEHHPVEFAQPEESSTSRAEVKAELAKHGVPDVRA